MGSSASAFKELLLGNKSFAFLSSSQGQVGKSPRRAEHAELGCLALAENELGVGVGSSHEKEPSLEMHRDRQQEIGSLRGRLI